MEQMLDMLNQMNHLSGCKRITRTYQAFISEPDLDSWAGNFKYKLSDFKEHMGDFDQSNLTSFLKKIYEGKCKDSMKDLKEMFVYIWNCR